MFSRIREEDWSAVVTVTISEYLSYVHLAYRGDQNSGSLAVVCRYTASTDDSSLVPRVLRATDSESVDFVASSGRHSSRRVTSSARYDKHDVIADLGGPAKPVIPTPLSAQRRSPHSWVSIGTQWTISHQTELLREARLLSGQLIQIHYLLTYLLTYLITALLNVKQFPFSDFPFHISSSSLSSS